MEKNAVASRATYWKRKRYQKIKERYRKVCVCDNKNLRYRYSDLVNLLSEEFGLSPRTIERALNS
jgi:ribosomal protein S17